MRHALEENIQFILVLNKIDRLILELCLTPTDAYEKLKHTVEEVNTYIRFVVIKDCLLLIPIKFQFNQCGSYPPVEPRTRQCGICKHRHVLVLHSAFVWPDVCEEILCFYFSCVSVYELMQGSLGFSEISTFATRLWGDVYFDSHRQAFTRTPPNPESKRTFVSYILEPLYKLYSEVVNKDVDSLWKTLQNLGIKLHPVIYNLDTRTLLHIVLKCFFESSDALIDIIVEFIPSPLMNAQDKV